MKLSEKGKRKIPDNFYWFANEFEPDDFEGCVVLTVEEAKEILQSSYDVLSWANCGYTHTDNALKVQKLLKDRIEQAEREHE